MNKTPIQELISAITQNGHIIINQTLIDTYLEKEKQQIIEAHKDGFEENVRPTHETSEQYYNEKYNKVFDR